MRARLAELNDELERALRRRARAADRHQHRRGDRGHRRRGPARRSRPATPSTRRRGSSRRREPGQVLVVGAHGAGRARLPLRRRRSELELRGKAEPLRAVELVAEQPITEGTLSGTRAPLVGRRRELELLDHDVPARRRGGAPPPGHALRRGGRRQEPARRRAARRARGRVAGAARRPRPLPLLRRRHQLLAARRDAQGVRAVARRRRRPTSRAPASPRPPRPSLAAAGVDAPARTSPRCSASASASRRPTAPSATRRSCVPRRTSPGARSSRRWPRARRRSSSSRTSSGPTRPCSSCSRTSPTAPPARCCVLCTARPELTTRRPTWGGGRRSFTGLVVEPLGPTTSAQLVELLLGESVGDRERAAIARARRGQPVLPRGDRRARARRAPAARGLPDTVQAALAARIDLLPADEKRALQAAAVVGRVFWPGAVAEVAALDAAAGRRAARPPAGPRPHPRPALVVDERPARADLQARARSATSPTRACRGATARACTATSPGWIELTFAGRRDEVVELIAHHRAAAYRARSDRTSCAPLRSRRSRTQPRAPTRAPASSGRSRSRARRSSSPRRRSSAPARSRRSATPPSSPSTDRPRGSRCARPPTSSHAETPGRPRPARRGSAASRVMIPTRASGLMRAQPPAEEVRRYLELGLAVRRRGRQRGARLLLAAAGLLGLRLRRRPRPTRAATAGARRPSARARSRGGIGRPDLELLALDAIVAGLNMRGLYGLAEPIDRERARDHRAGPRPVRGRSTPTTPPPGRPIEVGRYRDVVALAAEFEALDERCPAARPAVAGGARAPAARRLGRGARRAGAAARAARRRAARTAALRERRLWRRGADPRGARRRAGADALRARSTPGRTAGVGSRDWALPHSAIALGRRGDFAEAHAAARPRSPRWRHLPRPRELEARCTLIAEEGAWDEAAALVDRARGTPTRRAARAPAPRRPAGGPRPARGGRRRRRGRPRWSAPPRASPRSTPRWEVALTELCARRGARRPRASAEAAATLSARPPCSSGCACRASSSARARCSAPGAAARPA